MLTSYTTSLEGDWWWSCGVNSSSSIIIMWHQDGSERISKPIIELACYTTTVRAAASWWIIYLLCAYAEKYLAVYFHCIRGEWNVAQVVIIEYSWAVVSFYTFYWYMSSSIIDKGRHENKKVNTQRCRETSHYYYCIAWNEIHFLISW